MAKFRNKIGPQPLAGTAGSSTQINKKNAALAVEKLDTRNKTSTRPELDGSTPARRKQA
jgi:hypothetical protein